MWGRPPRVTPSRRRSAGRAGSGLAPARRWPPDSAPRRPRGAGHRRRGGSEGTAGPAPPRSWHRGRAHRHPLHQRPELRVHPHPARGETGAAPASDPRHTPRSLAPRGGCGPASPSPHRRSAGVGARSPPTQRAIGRPAPGGPRPLPARPAERLRAGWRGARAPTHTAPGRTRAAPSTPPTPRAREQRDEDRWRRKDPD